MQFHGPHAAVAYAVATWGHGKALLVYADGLWSISDGYDPATGIDIDPIPAHAKWIWIYQPPDSSAPDWLEMPPPMTAAQMQDALASKIGRNEILQGPFAKPLWRKLT